MKEFLKQGSGGIKSFFVTAGIAVALTLWGCGINFSGSYDESSSLTQTDSVLIQPATLKGWMDNDLVNSDAKFEKVVILDVTGASKYEYNHIPGAVFWNFEDQYKDRVEGPAKWPYLVLDGAAMDVLIQKNGINDRTTIVFTSSQSTVGEVCRAYFLFRYWGFSRDKLKFLDGLNNAWKNAGYELTKDAPAVTESGFSVKDIAAFSPDFRASLSEMIAAVQNGNGTPVDFRPGSTGASGTTKDVITTSKYVVYDGVMKGGKFFDYLNLTNSNLTFKDAATITAELFSAGIDTSKIIYAYCRSGVVASAGFFVLDAILKVDDGKVMLYDGSWGQWGQMASITTLTYPGGVVSGGVLPASSQYLTDINDGTNSIDRYFLNDIVNYNADDNIQVATLTLDGPGEVNQVEKEDALYMQGIESSSPDTGATGADEPAPDSGGY